MLDLAKVVEIHPESHAVDLEFMDDGRRIPGVQVLSHSAGGDMGLSDLSQPTNVGYDEKPSQKRDIYAAVSWSGSMPFVIGFLFPQVAQCLFEDINRMVYRHASDVYMTVDGDGNTEVFHPSGTYLRIGTKPEHEDLTGKDYDQIWKIDRNTDKAVHVHLEVASAGSKVASLDIDPSGNLSIENSGEAHWHSGGQMAFESDSGISLDAPRIDLNE